VTGVLREDGSGSRLELSRLCSEWCVMWCVTGVLREDGSGSWLELSHLSAQ